MENFFLNQLSHQKSFLSIFTSIFSNEQLFAIMNRLIELKKIEIENELNQQKLYISQVELSKKAIEKEIAYATHNLMCIRSLVNSNFLFDNQYEETIKSPKNETIKKQETSFLERIYQKSSFKYKIALANDLPLLIYKDKPFNIFFKIDHIKTGRIIRSIEHLSFQLFLLKAGGSHPIIYKNLIGEDIISYESLNSHSKFPGCIEFQQIRIKEVSSHFIKGCFYLCLMVKDATNEQNNFKKEEISRENKFYKFYEKENEKEERISCEKSEIRKEIDIFWIKYQKIDAKEIMPLVIPHLIVRSKKKKKKII